MTGTDDMTRLGMTFDQVPERYHRLRPRYPTAMFDRIAGVAGLHRGSRVLELGSGTGIATQELLARNWKVDCVEPGVALVSIARQHLDDAPGLTIHEARFETWPLPEEPFDLVFAATSFHWIPAGIRFRKSHKALKPDGHLAVMHYRHVAGGDTELFDKLQECYIAHMPGADRTRRNKLPSPLKNTQAAAEMRKSGLFDIASISDELTIIEYSRDQYLELLSTYSGHIALDEEHRHALFACIARTIDEAGGRIRKAYRNELVIGKRR